MWIRRYVAVVGQRQTYLGLAYLALRLPFAVLYGGILAFVFSVGFRNPTTLILLLPVGLAIWGIVLVERAMARDWFHAELLPMAPEYAPDRRFRDQVRDLVVNPVTWKVLAYAAIEVPLGAAVGVATMGLFAGLVGAALAAVGYALSIVFYGGDSQPWISVPVLLICAGGALMACVGSLHLVRWVSGLQVRLVQVLLSASRSQLDLADARAEADRERTRAEAADRSRRDLVMNVSHELRNPLATIRAHVDTLQGDDAGEPSPDERQRYLKVLGRETDRLAALVEELLSLASAESGDLHLEMAPVSAAAVATQVHDAMAPLAQRERHIKLLCSVEPEPEPVLADRGRLVQVLMNLVRNAITHTPDGGLVSIEVAGLPEGAVEMRVSDTGPGISPEDAGRIFDRFYRVDSSRARATGGFGLGLAIAREMVEAMGGRIRVDSVVGQGSRFTVTLGRA